MTSEAKKPKMGRPRKSDAAKKRAGYFRPSRARDAKNTAARKSDLTIRPGTAPNLRLIPAVLPRIGKAYLLKAIECLPGFDPYRDAGDCTFDWKAAKEVVDFFHQELSHVKGELGRQPFLLEQWEVGIVANLFGWKKPDGFRRFREAFVFVPRKNGKTPFAAGIVTYMLFEEDEPGAEIYGAAAKHDQACRVFEHARGMVLQNAELTERAKIFNGQAKCIELPDTFGVYKAVASDADTSHGYNASGVVADELHAWKTSSELLEVLETSMGARRQPLMVIITTSDYERPGSACNEKHEYASKVRDGIITDPTFLPAIYEASVEDDWHDPKVWEKANPNLGISMKREEFERLHKKACDMPSFENTFKRLHLNIRTEQAVRWIPMDLWDACKGELDVEELKDCPCWGGLDLSSTADITCFLLLFNQNDKMQLVPYFWVPAEIVNRNEKKNKKFYKDWVRAGLMRETPGNTIDYQFVRRDINAIAEEHSVQGISIDRLFQGAQLATELMQDGFDVVTCGQGFYAMASPTLSFQTRLIAGEFVHGGNPVLRWMASNVSVETDAAGNMKPTKAMSMGKIDGIVTAIMALAMFEQADDGASPFEDGMVFA